MINIITISDNILDALNGIKPNTININSAEQYRNTKNADTPIILDTIRFIFCSFGAWMRIVSFL